MFVKFAASCASRSLVHLGYLEQFFLEHAPQLTVDIERHARLRHGRDHRAALIELRQKAVAHAQQQPESHHEDRCGATHDRAMMAEHPAKRAEVGP